MLFRSILIVDFANELQQQGQDKFNAILNAAAIRLRPILMTTGAMVFGAIPLVIASGLGSLSLNQIGSVIIGGMTFGSILTLLAIPTVYLMFGRQLSKEGNTAL